MPTVLGGKGKLSVVSFLVRCACSQVTRSQHSSCAKDILKDMTHSWPSQQVLGGDQAQRMLYHSKEAKPPSTQQQRQGRGDAQLRMAHHPRLAPHKSMLADDLKLSSDEDDTQKATREPASWDGHSLSVQRAHTHGRRVRHSSSDSSDSDCSAESCSSSSSLCSRSPSRSPEVQPDPESPADLQRTPCHSKESDRPSAAQWQLDKWLKKSKSNSSSSEQDPSQRIPGRLPSPHNQRAPSPARAWDSNQEYSPSQTPIPSPLQFHYSHNNPVLSPGYSYCPSPSPFTSTCPSPSPSPRSSPIPSPDISFCTSPHGSPRTSRSPSPITREPPKSPCPSPPAPSSRVRHYPETQIQTQPGLTLNPHRPKTKSSSLPQPPRHSRTQPQQNQDRNHGKSKASADLSCKQTHVDKSRPKHNCHPTSKQLSEAHKDKHAPHLEQSSRSNHRPRSLFQSNSQHSPTRAKHLVSTSRETNPGLGSLSQSTSAAVPDSNAGLNSRSNTSFKHRAKPREAKTPTPVHGNHTKTTQKKTQPRQQEVEHRGDRPNRGEERRAERKEERYREKHQGKQERKEDRRLAEEQLLRRSWFQSSAEENEEEEEEEEEEGVIERQRRREETERGGHCRRREQKQRREWQTAQAKQLHCRQEEPRRQARTEKRVRTEEERDRSPPLSRSPTPQRPSSSSASSSSDSEPEYPAPIAKVSADSTSHERVSKRRQQEPRPASHSQKPVHPRGPAPGNLGEGQPSEGKQKLYTLVPFGRGDHVTTASQRGLRNLVVQIDLCLLRRVPESTGTTPVKKPSSSTFSSPAKDKQRDMKHLCIPDSVTKDNKRKRKLENGVSHKESKRSATGTNHVAGRKESERPLITETTHNGLLEEYLDSKRPMSPVSPLSDDLEPTKPASKTKASEQHPGHVQKNKEKSRDSSIKPKMEEECVKVLRPPQPPPESWGPAGHRGAVPNHETPHHAEYYLHEAKRMKHRADAMVDKLGKAVNYIDAALSFMECGKAMEEGPLEAKSPYAMYSETVELIRYAMRLKSHSGPAARQEDKQLAVLCFRCLALLYWQMFRLKKDHALKYSRVLLDYFKSSPKLPSAPPSWTDNGKGAGGAPPSLSPNAKHTRQGSHGGSHSPSVISIPQRIHQMAANHLNITNSVLYSYEYWEVADNLAKENKEFFNYLNTLSGPLTLHSSIAHAVQYTRQALQWIRISAKLN